MSVYNYDDIYKQDLYLINNELDKIISKNKNEDNIVKQAMNYVIENGGKRIRSIITLEFCKACDKDKKRALPFACAVELIHSSSLIQDDLPMMDNAPIRRGKPSCHNKYGQPVAILASDALSVLAFDVILSYSKTDKLSTLKVAQTLLDSIGINGLIGGQALDILNEDKPINISELEKIYTMKTETLFLLAAKLGCVAGNATKCETQNALNYAKNIGLAYQIVDDILDLTSNEEVLGKKTLVDVQSQKTTYPSLLGLNKSRKLVTSLTKKAISSLDIFPDEQSRFLKELALKLEERQY